jgi:restriction endonuclease S subunit
MRKGWVQATLKDALEPIANRPNGKEYPLVLSVTEKRGIIPQTEVFKHRIATDDISKYKVLEPMDIAYNPYLLWCGAIGQWKGLTPGVVSPVYECFRVKESCVPRYLGLIFETGILTDYFNALAIGSIVRRRRTIPSDFIAAPILLPPLPEQKRIADLISSVDSYIEALEQQAECARKSRSAVLHEMLSVGGDGWIATTLGEVATCAGGSAFPVRYQGSNEGIPFIKVSDMNLPGNEIKIHFASNFISNEIAKKLKVRIWPHNTVIFPKVGAALLTNKRRILSEATIFDNNVMGLVTGDELNPIFLLLFMQTIDMNDYVQNGALPSISNEIVKGIDIYLPPLLEQERIVDLISSIDGEISAIEKLISQTKNLRSGLLSDLLSGDHEIPESYDIVIGANL